MLRSLLIVAVALSVCSTCAIAAETPPVMPKVQESPLPPAVTLPPPPAACPVDVPNRPLSAEEAAAIALRHQPAVTMAIAGVNSAKGVEKQAASFLLPTLTASASYQNIAIAPTGFFANGAPVAAAVTPGYLGTASIRQLIFDFNHTRDLVTQSKAELVSAWASLSKVQSDLVLQVKQQFYTYAQNMRLVSVNEANVRDQQSHLALARAQLTAGVGLPADVVRAETAVASAIFNLNLAQNSASVARVNLATFMGIDPRTPIDVSDTSEPEAPANDVNALTDLALRRRPEMAEAQANTKAALFGVRAAKTSNAPSLGANAGWIQHAGTGFPNTDRTGFYGVAINWTPWDSGLTAGKVEQAQAELLSAQAQQESTRLSVVSDVAQAYVNLKTAEQRAVTADSEVANAKEALRLVMGRYSSGLGIFLDVLDAQSALLTANTNRVNNLSVVNQARAALAHAINAPGPAQTSINPACPSPVRAQ